VTDVVAAGNFPHRLATVQAFNGLSLSVGVSFGL
jgi:hypothetical protein